MQWLCGFVRGCDKVRWLATSLRGQVGTANRVHSVRKTQASVHSQKFPMMKAWFLFCLYLKGRALVSAEWGLFRCSVQFCLGKALCSSSSGSTQGADPPVTIRDNCEVGQAMAPSLLSVGKQAGGPLGLAP